MTRRALLFAILEPRTPTDPDSLNRFAIRWNAYLSQLQRGIVDLKAWSKVNEAWQALK